MNTNKSVQLEGLFQEEGYQLMAAAFEVHSSIGGGLAEEVYQECLEMELASRNIPSVARQEIAIFYKDIELRKRYIPDLYVFGEIIVELKSAAKLAPEHIGQPMNYMRLTRKKVGCPINFGPLNSVEWKRFVI